METDKIASAIRTARQKAGLTQNQVAEYFGKTQTTVAAWERGRAQPDAKTVAQLAKLFDVSGNYLLGLSDFYKDKDHDINSEVFSYGLENCSPDLAAKVSELIRQVSDVLGDAIRLEPGIIDAQIDCFIEITNAISNIAVICDSGYDMLVNKDRFREQFDKLAEEPTNYPYGKEALLKDIELVQDSLKKLNLVSCLKGTTKRTLTEIRRIQDAVINYSEQVQDIYFDTTDA